MTKSERLTLLLQKPSIGHILRTVPTISSLHNLCQLSSDMFLESLTCQISVEWETNVMVLLSQNTYSRIWGETSNISFSGNFLWSAGISLQTPSRTCSCYVTKTPVRVREDMNQILVDEWRTNSSQVALRHYQTLFHFQRRRREKAKNTSKVLIDFYLESKLWVLWLSFK